jgi:tRNA (guanine9-N1)-methyltransferase
MTAAIISKNQLKRKLKQERIQELNKVRKIEEKKRRKEKKAVARQLHMTTTDESESPKPVSVTKVQSEEERLEARRQGKEHKEKLKADRLALCRSNWMLVIDCAWEDIHRERPLTSLSQQIMFCYGANNRSSAPCLISLTGVGPRLTAQLNKVDISKWNGVTVSNQEYTVPTFEDRKLVYLTSDAEETLTSLETDTAYIIGGIVDRNAHKGITYKKACDQGLRTAKLPIREHCDLTSSSVLTVNQIVDIILKYGETRSWASAIASVIPARKQVVLKSEDDVDEDEDSPSKLETS